MKVLKPIAAAGQLYMPGDDIAEELVTESMRESGSVEGEAKVEVAAKPAKQTKKSKKKVEEPEEPKEPENAENIQLNDDTSSVDVVVDSEDQS